MSENHQVVPERVMAAVDGGEPIGSVNLGSFTRSIWTVARNGRGLTRRAGELGVGAAKVLAGRSDISPARGDSRFRDDAWSENPAYRRLMQLYLLWSEAVLGAVDDAELEWREEFRARFFLTILTSAMAPTNFLLGNPAALKRILDTGGASLVHGTRHLVRDLLSNNGQPTQVDHAAFKVGENLAATPGAVVYRDEVCEVLQYAPTTPQVRGRPVLMIPPQINRYYFMDLAPGRSFVEHAVARGLTFFTISWRNPGPEQAHWNLDTYASAVERALGVVTEITRSEDVNLLSLCAGGILTATVLNHLAANGDNRVRSASFGVTLLDFDVPAPLGLFDVAPLLSSARASSRRSGVLSGASLGSVFTWMRPDDLVWNYWVNNNLLGRRPPKFDILAWNGDSMNMSAELHGEFLELFANNLLVQPGALDVLDTPVDLGRVEVETYVTGAVTDHLTPWKGCYRTTQLFSGPSTFVLSNAGHIASLVNPPGNPKAHYFAGPEPGPDPDEWRAGAEQRQGTWWEHWADWVTQRSGEERRARSKLGSRRHPVIEAAPGRYVRS
jgi:polyhydroxyalkanoate synthase